jgi:predicted kinase
MKQNKKIYLLIGAKGSGKSFIGMLMEEHFGVKFIRVEDWAQKIKAKRAINNEAYLTDVFQGIEDGIREVMIREDIIVFESTGLTSQFDRMLKNLQGDFSVITILVEAKNETCLRRVKTREQSIHIAVSDEQVNEINKLVQEKQMPTDHCVTNENKSAKELVAEISKIIA